MIGTGVGAIVFVVVGAIIVGVAVLLATVFAKLFQLVAWAISRLVRLTAGLVGRVGAFARDTLIDGLHASGALLTAGVLTPLALLNTLLGRWPTAKHYGLALEDELLSAARSVYRLSIGNPIRLVGLTVLTRGIEQRMPSVAYRSSRTEKPGAAGRPRTTVKGEFPGYEVVGTLPAGGSGASIFVAVPTAAKLVEFEGRGHSDPGKVVIKAFDLESGSTLPQIVRESRALEAAKHMGLVLEHELGQENFHYVMPFVPGDDLAKVTLSLHDGAPEDGLSDESMGTVVRYAADLLRCLDRFHTGGLWHKDIKPSNLIVSEGRVHLVDFGLVTPLGSALTLTTHGTEYFRDPEMVRQAMRGVKVQDVDGALFDVYSAGAVLYSMIEGSFPAQGSLSPIGKRCPDALQWIVRRSMADMNSRYGSAVEMLADLATLESVSDPYAVKPMQLPSYRKEDPKEVLKALGLRDNSPERPVYVSAGHGTNPREQSEDDLFEFPSEYHAGMSRAKRRAARRRHGRKPRRALAMACGIFACFIGAGAVLAGISQRMYRPARITINNGSFETHPHEVRLSDIYVDPRVGIITTPSTPKRPSSSTHARSMEHVHQSPESVLQARFVDPRGSQSTQRDFTHTHGQAAAIPMAEAREHEKAQAQALREDRRRQQQWRSRLNKTLAALPTARRGVTVTPRVLVLEDLLRRADPQSYDALIGYLSEAGIETVGSREGIQEDAYQMEIVAEALKVIGSKRPEDPEATQLLQEFIQSEAMIEGVIWLVPDANRQLRYCLSVRELYGAQGLQGIYPTKK